MISLFHYLGLSALLFVIGVGGILLNWRNSIKILMSIELILLGVMLNFIAFASFHQNNVGHVFGLFILTVAAAESAIGLAIILIYFRNRHSINPADQPLLKG